MRRVQMTARADWRARCEEVGFSFHSIGPSGIYWNENAAYEFTAAQIDHIEAVTEDLHARMLAAVEWIIDRYEFKPFGLQGFAIEEIIQSWRRGDPSLYGRFDFSWDGSGEPKLLEYNADTPTALLEASVVQWHWLQDVMPHTDQFNSLHEKLIERWRELHALWPQAATVHFAACADNDEDQGTTAYLLDTAMQAGMQVKALCIEDIGFDPTNRCFADMSGNRIQRCFKLYPWEWMFQDEFAEHLVESKTLFIEPPWKVLLSSKAILPILASLNPGHPNILPASFNADIAVPYVRKPRFSREGSNVTLTYQDHTVATDGPYGNDGYIYQAAAPLPQFAGQYTTVATWIIGNRAAGLGIREDAAPITTDTSQFIPHYFV